MQDTVGNETMPNGDIWGSFNRFNSLYEQRHAVLEQRITRLEERQLALASREDVERLRGTIQRFEEAFERFETSTNAMATKTDMEWVKKAFWTLTGATITGGVGIIVALVQHVLNTGVP